MTTLPQEIFKAYDIRGVVGDTLTDEIVRDIGQAIDVHRIEEDLVLKCVAWLATRSEAG